MINHPEKDAELLEVSTVLRAMEYVWTFVESTTLEAGKIHTMAANLTPKMTVTKITQNLKAIDLN